MFAFKLATLLAVASAAFASPYPGSGSSCSTGTVSCCNTSQPATSSDSSTGGDLLGPVDALLNIPVALTCTPLNVLGIGGNACNAQAACCQNVSGGLLNVDCDPINLGL